MEDRVRGRTALGVAMGPARPEDDLLLRRACLMGALAATLSRFISRDDARMAALQRYYWMILGRTITREEMEALLSDSAEPGELQKKAVAVRRMTLHLASPAFASLVPDQIGAGLEESEAAVREAGERVASTLAQLAESRQAKGLVVVSEDALESNGLLETFLRVAPPDLADSIVLWGGERSRQLTGDNPALRFVEDTGDPVGAVPVLANSLAQMAMEGLDFSRVGVLGRPDVVSELSGLLRADIGVSASELQWDLSLVLQLLGVPQEVLGAVDLDVLAKDLLTLKSA